MFVAAIFVSICGIRTVVATKGGRRWCLPEWINRERTDCGTGGTTYGTEIDVPPVIDLSYWMYATPDGLFVHWPSFLDRRSCHC